MLLGKRSRPPIKRTTSMTAITVDITNNMDSSSDPSSDGGAVHTNRHASPPPDQLPHLYNMNFANNSNIAYDQQLLSMVSPRNPRSSNHDFQETAHFLRTCGLCNRRLAPGKDIYMYRGDTAFCSLECREQKMKQDDRKEKSGCGGGAAASKKEGSGGSHASRGGSSGATSKGSPSESETVAAA